MTDLIARLTEAATAAIENERPGLAYDVGRLRTVTVELEIQLSGAVVVGNCYIQRRGKARKGAAA